MTQAVSVIIPSLDSPIIDRVISSVRRQEPAGVIQEVIVVGKDNANLIRPEASVQFIDTGEPVSAGTARNIGIKTATASLLLFLDSDCLAEPGWLAEHLDAQAAGHAVVGGGVLPTGQNYWHRAYNLSLFNKTLTTSPPGPREILPTLNLSVAREVTEKSGLMNGELLRGQDADWIQRMRRAGFQPYFCPSAAVRHEHNRRDLPTFWRDSARSGYFMRRIRLEHRDLLDAPALLEYPGLLRLLAPFIGVWSLMEISRRHPGFLSMYWQYLPAIFASKLAWCWGAGKSTPPSQTKRGQPDQKVRHDSAVCADRCGPAGTTSDGAQAD